MVTFIAALTVSGCAAPIEDAPNNGEDSDAIGGQLDVPTTITDAQGDNNDVVANAKDSSAGTTADSDPADAQGCSCSSDDDCPDGANECLVARCLSCQCVVLQLDGLVCDDGKPCTVADVCKAGECTSGTDLCACHADTDCDTASKCEGTAFCDKGSMPWKCVASPGSAVTCDPGKDTACATNECDPSDGKCAQKPRNDGLACTDGDNCTIGEVCKAGTCAGGSSVCKCQQTSDCGLYEDGDSCNGTLICDKSTFPFACVVNPATVVTCGADGDDACKANVCQPKTGKCVLADKSDGTDCSNGASCLVGGCKAGVCKVSDDALCACASTADCSAQEDGDACNGTLFCDLSQPKPVCKLNPSSVVTCPTAADTECEKSVCNPTNGKCSATEIGRTVKKCANGDCAWALLPPSAPTATNVPCDDGDPCSKSDVCNSGQCSGTKGVCPCKLDADCAKQDDGNLCNGTLFCDLNKLECAFNPATVVTCKTVENTACAKLACHPKTGKCVATPVQSAVQNCTSQAGQQSCAWEVNLSGPNQAVISCDDGDPCTKSDVCVAGVCAPGPSQCECKVNADCAAKDDGNSCNGIWVCQTKDKLRSCIFDPLTKVICGDQPASVCLKKGCVASTGTCALVAVNDGGKCDDGQACTTADTCAGGACAGKTNDCNDSNPCTQDSCLKAQGCVHKQVACDDGNACTADKCDEATGQCSTDAAKLNGASCNADDNPCTPLDVCKSGSCVAGKPFVCVNPTKACQKAVCIPSADKKTSSCGVIDRDDGDACADDGKSCTIGAKCASGVCAAGAIERYHTAPMIGSNTVFALAPATDGDVFAVGAVSDATSAGASSSVNVDKWWVAALAPTSKPRWQWTAANEVATKAGHPAAIAVNGGQLVVAGTTATQSALHNVQVAVLSTKGDLVWRKNFGKPSSDEAALAVAVRDSGAVAAAGWSGKPGTRKFHFVRLTSTGSFIWERDIAANGGTATDVRFRADGGLVFVGCKATGGKCQLAFGQLAANGVQEGTLQVHSHVSGIAPGKMAPTKDGWLVAATVGSGPSERAAWTRIRADGSHVFTRTTTQKGSAHAAIQVGVDRWILAGSTDPSGGNRNAVLFAVDGYGNRQWLRESDGGGHDVALALGVRSNGTLVAGGWRENAGKSGGMLISADMFGHASCATVGACEGKKADACGDQKACTADDCNAAKGCTATPVDAFKCDPNDGCSIDGKCSNGACKPEGDGRLFSRTHDASATKEMAFDAVVADGKGYAVAAHTTRSVSPAIHLLRLDEKGHIIANRALFFGKKDWVKYRPVSARSILPRSGGGWVVGGGAHTGSSVPEWFEGKILFTKPDGSLDFDMKAADVMHGCSMPADVKALAAYPDGTFASVIPCGLAIQVQRINSAGKILWFSNHSQLGQREWPAGAAVSLAGDLVVAGHSRPVHRDDQRSGLLTAFDIDGKQKWQRNYANGNDSWLSTVVATKSGYIAAGTTKGASMGAWLLEVDTAGKALRSRTLLDAKFDVQPAALIAHAQGFFALATASTGIIDHARLLGLNADLQPIFERTVKHGVATRPMSSGGAALLVGGDVVTVGAAGSTSSPIPWVARLDIFGHTGCEALGKCAGETYKSCDDGKPCTLDGCEGTTGCTHLPNDCSDGFACTTDACDAKSGCQNTNAACSDNNPCTADACDAVSGCAHLGPKCDDGDVCTSPACSPTTKCPGRMFAGRCFEIIPVKSSFNSAKAHCAATGRKLLTVRNAAENQFVRDYATEVCQSPFSFVRLGFYSPSGSKAKYVWQDNSPTTFTRWVYSLGAPPGNATPAVMLLNSGRWQGGESNYDSSSIYRCFGCMGVPQTSCKQAAIAGCK